MTKRCASDARSAAEEDVRLVTRAHASFRSMNAQWGLYSSGISLSGYDAMSVKPLAWYILWAAVMKSCCRDGPLVAGDLRVGDQLGEHGAAETAAAMQRVDVHALDLSGLGPDSLHAGNPDRDITLERQQEPTVRDAETWRQSAGHALPPLGLAAGSRTSPQARRCPR